MAPHSSTLPGKSHGQRSLVGCSPWGHQESDTTEPLHFHFSLSCIEGGNGSPLQCSCLENPRDGRGWWAAVYGVAQSQTRLKRLSRSSMTFLSTDLGILIFLESLSRYLCKLSFLSQYLYYFPPFFLIYAYIEFLWSLWHLHNFLSNLFKQFIYFYFILPAFLKLVFHDT